MAEAQQEQPQAHQPQPEPVIAAAQELAHVLPHQSPVKPLLSGATAEKEIIQQGAQGQVRVEAHVTTSQGPDANSLDLARAPTPNLQVANNATTTVAVAHAQEPEPAQQQEQGLGQGHQSSQQLTSNRSTDDINSTSTPAIASPVTVSKTATVVVDQATPPPAIATIDGVQSDQQQKPVQDGCVAPSSSDAMSNNPSHHPSGPPRQPPTYQNPAAYTTPGMSGAQYGYANAAGQAPDTYRTALPSMRTFDPVQQQAQQQQHMAMAMPVNPIPSVPSMPPQQHMPYFGQQPLPMTASNPYALPPDSLRPQYALPPSDPTSVLSGRQKKVLVMILSPPFEANLFSPFSGNR